MNQKHTLILISTLILFIGFYQIKTVDAARTSDSQCESVLRTASPTSSQYIQCQKIKSSSGSGSNSNSSSGGGGSAGPFSLSNVTWIDTNVSGWSQTATLNAGISGGNVSLSYNKASSWKTISAAGTDVNANAWIFVPYNGGWYASTWEWLRPGQQSKPQTAVYGPGHLKGALSGWAPTDGQTYYFMVSTPARGGERSSNERSNVSAVTWSGGVTGAVGGEGFSGTTYTYKDTTTITNEAIERNSQYIQETLTDQFDRIELTTNDIEVINDSDETIQFQSVIPMEYTYYDGEYDLTGYLVLPSCYSYDVDLDGSRDEWDINITTEKEPGVVCTSRMTTHTFEEQIDYDGVVDIKAYINDEEVDLELFDMTVNNYSENEDYYYGDDGLYTTTNYTSTQNNNTQTNTEQDVDVATLVNLLISAGIIPADKVAQVRAALGLSSSQVSTPISNTSTNTSTTNTTSNTQYQTSGNINIVNSNRNSSVFTGYNRDLTLGSVGADVQQLQRFLNNNGYTIATTGVGSPGNEFTYFGTATRSALIRFQQANNITPASGYFGPVTRGIVE